MADKEKAEKANIKASEVPPKNVTKDKKEAASEKKSESREKPAAEDIRGIVRVAGKDVKGHVPMKKALSHVKGVGRRYAEVCSEIAAEKLKVNENIPIGKLSDAQLEEIESIITSPQENGLPLYMLNRRKEFTTGKDMHLISNDLDYAVKQDVDREMKSKTWRGISHMYRKKVRGQRTRTRGRKGGSVGVVKKKEMPGKAPAKKEEKK
ncbi:MAG: 30S ribosomal protein S13 [Candidatus Micrarchaeia archaeon]